MYGLSSARRLFEAGDLLAALTVVGLAACVVSPISWAHHLWWIAPALLILLDRAIRERSLGTAVTVAAMAIVFVSGLPDRTRVSAGHHLDSLATVAGENTYALCLILIFLAVSRTRSSPSSALHCPPHEAFILGPRS